MRRKKTRLMNPNYSKSSGTEPNGMSNKRGIENGHDSLSKFYSFSSRKINLRCVK